MIDLPDAEDRTIDRIFIRLDKTPERDRQSDRRTDLQWLLQRSALQAMRTRCKS